MNMSKDVGRPQPLAVVTRQLSVKLNKTSRLELAPSTVSERCACALEPSSSPRA